MLLGDRNLSAGIFVDVNVPTQPEACLTDQAVPDVIELPELTRTTFTIPTQ